MIPMKLSEIVTIITLAFASAHQLPRIRYYVQRAQIAILRDSVATK